MAESDEADKLPGVYEEVSEVETHPNLDNHPPVCTEDAAEGEIPENKIKMRRKFCSDLSCFKAGVCQKGASLDGKEDPSYEENLGPKATDEKPRERRLWKIRRRRAGSKASEAQKQILIDDDANNRNRGRRALAIEMPIKMDSEIIQNSHCHRTSGTVLDSTSEKQGEGSSPKARRKSVFKTIQLGVRKLNDWMDDKIYFLCSVYYL